MVRFGFCQLALFLFLPVGGFDRHAKEGDKAAKTNKTDP